jgi:hypothetical protein
MFGIGLKYIALTDKSLTQKPLTGSWLKLNYLPPSATKFSRNESSMTINRKSTHVYRSSDRQVTVALNFISERTVCGNLYA